MNKPAKDGTASPGTDPTKTPLRRDMSDFPGSVFVGLMAILHEYGQSPIGPPRAKRMQGTKLNLWEARVSHPTDKTIYRLIFTPTKTAIVALSAFQKKSRSTPPQEVKKAERRMKRAGLA